MIDFSAVQGAGIFQIPRPMYFGMKFEASAVMTLVILFIINSVQAIGDLSATSGGGLDREPTDKELSGGIIGYGITNILGSFFGGLPTATFSQNVGIVATTKVVNRVVLGLAAGIILLAGFVPKFSALLTTIPQCVLGGATISVFASIAMSGIKLVVQQPLTYRNTSIGRTFGCTRYGNHTVLGCAGTASGMGHNSIWKISGCCDDHRCYFIKCDLAER